MLWKKVFHGVEKSDGIFHGVEESFPDSPPPGKTTFSSLPTFVGGITVWKMRGGLRWVNIQQEQATSNIQHSTINIQHSTDVPYTHEFDLM